MSKNVFIKTITPVHIGSGKKIFDIEFLIDKEFLYRHDFNYLCEIAYQIGSEKFIKWVEEITQKMSQNGIKLDKLAELRRKFISHITNLSNNTIKKQDILKKSKYKIFCPTLGKKTELLEGIKTPSNELYIPGSSIKGAIRTALLNRAIKKLDNQIINNIKNKINKQINDINNINDENKRIRKKKGIKNVVGNFFENEIFYCGVLKSRKDGDYISYKDEKYDLLKIISISDSSSVPCDEYGQVCLIDLFKNNDDEQRQTPAVECIKSNTNLESIISIDTNFVKMAKRLLFSDNNQKTFGRKIWIDFKNKFERLFELSLQDLNDENIENEILNSIFNAVSEFANDLKEKELKWFTRKSEKNQGFFKYIEDYYTLNIKNSCIRLGYGTGFVGMSIYLSLYNNDEFKDTYKKLLEFLDIGAPQNKPDNWELKLSNFPTSKRLHSDGQNIMVLGWIQLSLDKSELLEIKEPNRSKKIERPKDSLKANLKEIKDNKVIVEILEGEQKSKETFISGFNEMRMKNLGLNFGDKIYVSLLINKNGVIEKADYKGKVSTEC